MNSNARSGNLPAGWKCVRVSDICTLGRGRVISQIEINESQGIYPVYSSQSQDEGIFGYLRTYDFEGEYVTWTTDGAYAGTVFYRSGRFNCTNVCGTLKAKDGLVSLCYLAAALSTRTKQHVSYVGNPKLMNNVMAEVQVLLPPLSEQRRIAEILDTVDEAIQKTEAVIAKLKQMRDGLLHDLLTRGLDENGKLRDPISHPEQFKDSPLGRIPREWKSVPLGKIASLQGGFAFSSTSSVENGTRWLKIANVSQGIAVWEDKSFLPEEFLKSYAGFVLHEDDIVIAMTRPMLSGVLKVAKVRKQDVPALLNQRVERLKGNPKSVTNDFLYILMQAKFVAEEIERLIFGTDPPNLSASQIESIIVPLPTTAQLHKITRFLDAHDTRIRTEVAYCDKLKQQKKGMMDDLLTGRVRV